MNFTKDERIKIWGNITSLCSEDMQSECKDKLHKLFAYGNLDMYFERLQDLHYAFEPFTSSNNDNYIENIETEKALLFWFCLHHLS